MPKWPRSSGSPRRVFGTCIAVPHPSAWAAARKARILSRSFSPGRLSTPEETSTDAAPEIRTASGNSSAVKPPDSIHWRRQDRPAISPQSKARPLPPGSASLRRGDRHRLHYRPSEPKPGLGNSFRALMAVELQDIDRRLGEDGADRVVVGIDKDPDSRDPRRNRGAEPRRFGCRDSARTRQVEVKAQIDGAARDRRSHRRLGRQTANLRGNAHLPLSAGGAGELVFGKEMSTRPWASGSLAALISPSRCC